MIAQLPGVQIRSCLCPVQRSLLTDPLIFLTIRPGHVLNLELVLPCPQIPGHSWGTECGRATLESSETIEKFPRRPTCVFL